MSGLKGSPVTTRLALPGMFNSTKMSSLNSTSVSGAMLTVVVTCLTPTPKFRTVSTAVKSAPGVA